MHNKEGKKILSSNYSFSCFLIISFTGTVLSWFELTPIRTGIIPNNQLGMFNNQKAQILLKILINFSFIFIFFFTM